LRERQKTRTWIPALATLLLLLFSAGADIGIRTVLEPPLCQVAHGLGTPAQSNETTSIATAGGRSLWVTKPTKEPGSRSVAVLNGHQVQKTVLRVSRSHQIRLSSSHDFAFVRFSSVRAPPVPAFAI